MIPIARRQFAQFLGSTAVCAVAQRTLPGWLVSTLQTASAAPQRTPLFEGIQFTSLPPSSEDDVLLPPGFRYEVLLRQGDVLNPKGDRYGDHNDYLAWTQRSADHGWLWINHEKASLSIILDDWSKLSTRTQASTMLESMGGSCITIRRQPDGRWRPVLPDRRNVRLNGLNTRFKVSGPAAGSTFLNGAREVLGTVGNCGGGVSPWGTFFSGEENYQNYFADPEMPEVEIDGKDLKASTGAESATFEQVMLVQAFYPRPTSHYGYIIEYDPDTGERWKHTALGRFSHENIAFTVGRDRRLVCYLGDDRMGQCLYKYISRDPFEAKQGKRNRRLLEHGTLHVANTERGTWIPLDPASIPALRNAGFDKARVSVHTRTAARLAGGTPHARPEDVEVHPVTGEVFVCITAHEQGKPPKGSAYTSEIKGAVGRIREAGNDASALEFDFDFVLHGAKANGLSWPDNLGFSSPNELLITSDYKLQPGQPIANSAQEHFGNNHLMLVPIAGSNAGRVTRFSTAPRGAEFCSPELSPDRSELWLNVQHPGEGSKSRDTLSSHWPSGGSALPRSSMIAISRIP